MAHEHHAKSLPADLSAPPFVNGWRSRALVVAPCSPFYRSCWRFSRPRVDHDGINHLLRSYLMGFVMCWSFAIGGMALLMVQYLTGGKWGLVVRRPLEAMSRTLPLVALMFLPVGFFMKKLYLWARIANPGSGLQGAPDHPRSGARDCLEASHAEHSERVDSDRRSASRSGSFSSSR